MLQNIKINFTVPCTVPPENCNLTQCNFCTILTYSRDHAIIALKRNFCATWATFVGFANFGFSGSCCSMRASTARQATRRTVPIQTLCKQHRYTAHGL